MYAPLSCERAGHVYSSLLVQLVSPSYLFAIPPSFSRPCSAAAQPLRFLAPVESPNPSRAWSVVAVVPPPCVACLCLAGCAAATRVQARGVSRSACAWGGVVGDVVARSDVHAGIALARPRGLLDCLWSWVLRRGLSREGFCSCCVARYRYRRRRRWWLGMGRAGFSQGLRSSAMRCELGGSWR